MADFPHESATPAGSPAQRARRKASSSAPAKRVQFSRPLLPWLFLAPQLLVIGVFFYWPSAQAIRSSFYIEDPFGFGASFAGIDNYTEVLASGEYRKIAAFTAFFSLVVTFLSLATALLLAVKAEAVLRARRSYRSALIAVYAIAPPVSGLIGMMLFDQHIGPFVTLAGWFGWHLQVGINYWDTAFAMILVAVWKQIPYNFIFLLAGLQTIPATVKEAALIDCPNGLRRFATITLPLLTPVAFFLIIMNMTYALFDTFALIDVMVKDKPADNPVTLVYKIYLDGFRGNDIGGSSAQSVILMLVVLLLTLVQFRFLERRVHYG
jgi:sn-glycerol 3-phosphate transport system permease protein